jgi:hypothetical protein
MVVWNLSPRQVTILLQLSWVVYIWLYRYPGKLVSDSISYFFYRLIKFRNFMLYDTWLKPSKVRNILQSPTIVSFVTDVASVVSGTYSTHPPLSVLLLRLHQWCREHTPLTHHCQFCYWCCISGVRNIIQSPTNAPDHKMSGGGGGGYYVMAYVSVSVSIWFPWIIGQTFFCGLLGVTRKVPFNDQLRRSSTMTAILDFVSVD